MNSTDISLLTHCLLMPRHSTSPSQAGPPLSPAISQGIGSQGPQVQYFSKAEVILSTLSVPEADSQAAHVNLSLHQPTAVPRTALVCVSINRWWVGLELGTPGLGQERVLPSPSPSVWVGTLLVSFYISTYPAAKVGKSFSLSEHTKGFSSTILQLYILL